MRSKLALALLLPTLTVACATVPSEVEKLTCPPLVSYDTGTQTKVANEKAAAEAQGAAWPRFIDDYGILRRQCRAISNDTK